MSRPSKKPEREPRSTPTFVVELELAVHGDDDRRLFARCTCAQRVNNALLQDGFGIVATMRSDPAWAEARKLPRATDEQRRERRLAYRQVRDAYGFAQNALESLAIDHKNAAGFAGRIGSHETQRIAERVFKALDEWVCGKRGKPRFKGRQRPLHSIEGKNNASCLQWFGAEGILQVESGWPIRVKLPDLGKDEWLFTALSADTKYCRLLWRNVRGVRRWFVQLMQEGHTPLKASILARLAAPDTQGGLDIGPSTIAWVTDTEAGYFRFCAEVDRPERAIRRLRRHVDRQRRANNPANFHPDGRALKGRRPWLTSQRQAASEAKLAELQRYEAEVRNQAHGRDVNFLLSQALNWRDDGVSPKALQARYGKSISKRAPGHFMSEHDRKAARAGGSRSVIEVRWLKNSQYDHSTNTFTKKALSERWHVFGDGRGRVQRDLYSAFLARNSEGKTYQPAELERAWQALAPALQRAGWYEPYQPTSRTYASRAPDVLPSSQSRSRVELLPLQQAGAAKAAIPAAV